MSAPDGRLTAFVLAADVAALKARADRLTVRDRLLLALRALEWATGDETLRTATLDFLIQSDIDTVEAGAVYRDALDNWRAALPHDLGAVLDGLDGEAAAAGWVTRKDCGHG